MTNSDPTVQLPSTCVQAWVIKRNILTTLVCDRNTTNWTHGKFAETVKTSRLESVCITLVFHTCKSGHPVCVYCGKLVEMTS